MGRSGGQRERKSKAPSSEHSTVRVQHRNGVEVVALSDAVPEFRQGRRSLNDTLVTDDIFVVSGGRKKKQQSHKSGGGEGGRAGEEFLHDAFPECFASKKAGGRRAVLERILNEGTYQISAAERKRLQDQRRACVINHFATHYVEPKTSRRIPVARIEAALGQIKVRVDHNVQIDKQLRDVKKAFVGVLPLAEDPRAPTRA